MSIVYIMCASSGAMAVLSMHNEGGHAGCFAAHQTLPACMQLQAPAAPLAGRLSAFFVVLLLRRPRLKTQMEWCMAHPEELSKVAGLQKKVDEVKSIMVDNIEQVRGMGSSARASGRWGRCLMHAAQRHLTACQVLHAAGAFSRAGWQCPEHGGQ